MSFADHIDEKITVDAEAPAAAPGTGSKGPGGKGAGPGESWLAKIKRWQHNASRPKGHVKGKGKGKGPKGKRHHVKPEEATAEAVQLASSPQQRISKWAKKKRKKKKKTLAKAGQLQPES